MTTKKYLRLSAVAERYGTTIRNIQRMAKDGRLPAPVFMGTRYPLWDAELLDERDRKMIQGRPRKDRAQVDAAGNEVA
jgi:predicted DNA-binding transcriptional regulator AlpA